LRSNYILGRHINSSPHSRNPPHSCLHIIALPRSTNIVQLPKILSLLRFPNHVDPRPLPKTLAFFFLLNAIPTFAVLQILSPLPRHILYLADDTLRRRCLDSDMHSPQLSTAAIVQPPGHAAIPSDPTSSPALSFFSKGHSVRPGSSISSIASSPLPLESTDSLGIPKRVLEDVTEEPHERENDFDGEVHYFCMPQSLPRRLYCACC
jgi:hypothetical protein